MTRLQLKRCKGRFTRAIDLKTYCRYLKYFGINDNDHLTVCTITGPKCQEAKKLKCGK